MRSCVEMTELNMSVDVKPLLGLRGLEIAGPSEIFQEGGLVPTYPLLGSLDDYSFPRPQSWGGRELKAGSDYRYATGRARGRQFIGDATTLDGIADGSYEIVLGSHVLEHFANPLKAMTSWTAALALGGYILQVIPHGEATFDRHRPVTTMAHLLDDFNRDVPNNDLTHHDEVRALSDQSHSDAWFADAHLHRGLHHHVFDTLLAVEVARFAGLTIVALAPVRPHHIVVLGQKGIPSTGKSLTNEDLTNILAHSPFRRDREVVVGGRTFLY